MSFPAALDCAFPQNAMALTEQYFQMPSQQIVFFPVREAGTSLEMSRRALFPFMKHRFRFS
jgi:hypothetical protein